MMFWIAAGAMVVVTTTALILPMLRTQRSVGNTNDYDVEVYKDQITELDREHAQGYLDDNEAAAARTEIALRLLTADNRRKLVDGDNAVGWPHNRHTLRITALTLMITVPSIVFTIYSTLGNPGLPGAPFAARDSLQSDKQTTEGNEDLNILAERLADRLKTSPEDTEGWLLLARTYMTLKRFTKAVRVFEIMLGLDPRNADLNGAYGEALTFAAGGTVTQAAQRAFDESLRIDPKDVRARYYSGLGNYQRGNKSNALDQWATLIADSPADASWLPNIRSRAEEAARDLGLNAEAILPRPLPAKSKKPISNRELTAEDLATASNMSTEERTQMISGMINRLAARLEDNPLDFEGWLRLIRALTLNNNQKDKAQEALDKALHIFAKAPFPHRQLLALGGELGLKVTTHNTSTRGPTAAEVEAAKDLSAEERAAMIEGMVGSLAERLEDEPHDTTGWIKLARSYDVLKRPVDLRNTLARAANFNPDNVEILIFYARALRAENGGKQSDTSVSIMRKILSIEPINIEALWFVAQAELQAGDSAKAKILLARALSKLPVNSTEYRQVKGAIEALDSE